MASATLTQDSLLPQPTGGLAPGAAAALLVHVGLLAALSISVDWRSSQPDVVAAELWAAVPQVASPPPTAPPPPPPPPPVPVAPKPTPPAPQVAKPPQQPDPDIALERDRRLKAEKLKAEEDLKKAEADRKKKAEDKKAEDDRKKREAAEAVRVAEEKAEDARIDKQRQENLRRIMAQAGSAPLSTNAAGNSAQTAAPSADYLARLRKMLRDQINFNGTVPGNAPAEVTVSAGASGAIISSKLSKSSGHDEWDKAVLRALERMGSLPRDKDGRVPPSFTFVFRQNE
jgi:colicin import membrane protein